jgi:predicted ATPase
VKAASIRALVLKRFYSIPAERVDFDNPTFLVGRNGAGKSNVVAAFAFLAEAMASPLQAVFDRRGGISTVRNRSSAQSYPPNLGLGVEFGALNGKVDGGRYAFEVKALKNYGFEVVREQCSVRRGKSHAWFDRKRTTFTTSSGGAKPALDPSALALPLIAGDERFAPVLKTLAAMRTYAIEPAKLREMQDPEGAATLRADGSNTASVLQEIERQAPQDVERVRQLLATIVPGTKQVRTAKHAKKLALEFVQEWGDNKKVKFEAFSMSDGTLRALGLLTAVFQASTPSVLVIEEPEATMHPGALGAILDLLRLAAKRSQLVVTTHSPELLDSAKWIEAHHLRAVTWQQGATHVRLIPEASKKTLQDHLMGAGELLRADALDAPQLFVDVAPSVQTELFEELS